MGTPIIPPEEIPVALLRNIGPKTARLLEESGIPTKRELLETGPILAYKILKHRYSGTSIVLLYALYGALNDCHWNELPPQIKEHLRQEAQTPLDKEHRTPND